MTAAQVKCERSHAVARSGSHLITCLSTNPVEFIRERDGAAIVPVNEFYAGKLPDRTERACSCRQGSLGARVRPSGVKQGRAQRKVEDALDLAAGDVCLRQTRVCILGALAVFVNARERKPEWRRKRRQFDTETYVAGVFKRPIYC